jgi:WD40 repeat protein
MLRRLAVVPILAALTVPLWGAQPQFWRLEEARDFLDGATEGLSVDSEGRVRLAPATHQVHDFESPYVWSLVRDGKGVAYAGTGNDGKIFRIEGGKATLLYDASELEVHALAVGPDGRLYAATSPDGKIYAIDSAGKATVFFDPGEKYIWALAFDSKGRLLVATGLDGKIHRVAKDGKDEILFTSTETHIVCLALDEHDNVYAGSSPSGIVYRIDPSGKVFVLYDSPYREVKAIDLGKDGSVYAALIDGKDKDKEEPSRQAPTLSLPPVAAAEVTVTESFTVAPGVPAPAATPAPRTSEAQRQGGTKGGVLRVAASGEADMLWSSTEDAPHCLIANAEGVLIGTGNKGKVYQIRNDRTWSMLGAFPTDQVTALHHGSATEILVATSNPGMLYTLGASPGTRGTFTSKVKDTETVSTWGRLRWDGTAPAGTEIQVQTRSGNTATPDSTWSNWSTAYTHAAGDAITSERARFLQIRVILMGKEGASPLLDSVATAYLQRNLRPQVVSVTVHPPGEVFQKPLSLTGEVEILGLDEPPGEQRPGAAAAKAGLPPATTYSRKLYQKGIQTLSWKADDPNNDSLVYDVSYRRVGDTRYRVLRKGLTEPVLAWDTTTVPNGRYVAKITAWDTPGNPPSLALSGEKESAPFDVDNTPPVINTTLQPGKPPRIQINVKDDSSIVRRVEYAVDGARWQEVHPTDGINDAPEENYVVTLGDLQPPGPHVVVIRATDLLGNTSTARVEVP